MIREYNIDNDQNLLDNNQRFIKAYNKISEINKQLEYNKKAEECVFYKSPYESYYRHVLSIGYLFNFISYLHSYNNINNTESNITEKMMVKKNRKVNIMRIYLNNILKLLGLLVEYKYINNQEQYEQIVYQMFSNQYENTYELDNMIQVFKFKYPMDYNPFSSIMKNLSKNYEAIIIVIFGEYYINNLKLLSIQARETSGSFRDKEYTEFWNHIIDLLSECDVLDGLYSTKCIKKELGQKNIELIEEKIKKNYVINKLENISIKIRNSIDNSYTYDKLRPIVSSMNLIIYKLIELYSSDSGEVLNRSIKSDLYNRQILDTDIISESLNILLKGDQI